MSEVEIGDNKKQDSIALNQIIQDINDDIKTLINYKQYKLAKKYKARLEDLKKEMLDS